MTSAALHALHASAQESRKMLLDFLGQEFDFLETSELLEVAAGRLGTEVGSLTMAEVLLRLAGKENACPRPIVEPGTSTEPEPAPEAKLTPVERAIQIYLRDPNQSTREVARQVPCDPSLLSRSEQFKKLRETYEHTGRMRKGNKKNGIVEAEESCPRARKKNGNLEAEEE